MSKLSICHASLLESYLSVKLAICQSYLFVMLATCHSYMSKQLAHLVPVLRKFLVKLPLTSCPEQNTYCSCFVHLVWVSCQSRRARDHPIMTRRRRHESSTRPAQVAHVCTSSKRHARLCPNLLSWLLLGNFLPIFAYCGLVVEIQPLRCYLFSFFAPLTSSKVKGTLKMVGFLFGLPLKPPNKGTLKEDRPPI